MTIRLTRREFAIAGSAAMLAFPASAQNTPPLMRPIPRSGELLPVVGLGTAYVFDSNDNTTRQKAAAVLQKVLSIKEERAEQRFATKADLVELQRILDAAARYKYAPQTSAVVLLWNGI